MNPSAWIRRVSQADDARLLAFVGMASAEVSVFGPSRMMKYEAVSNEAATAIALASWCDRWLLFDRFLIKLQPRDRLN